MKCFSIVNHLTLLASLATLFYADRIQCDKVMGFQIIVPYGKLEIWEGPFADYLTFEGTDGASKWDIQKYGGAGNIVSLTGVTNVGDRQYCRNTVRNLFEACKEMLLGESGATEPFHVGKYWLVAGLIAFGRRKKGTNQLSLGG
ncbi:uncharacterized protein PFL1_04707 [Pseudozyma flocculosa PF-1]|uniref:Uncharacterized protein n=2 Tax=Pseudozyma flocculosa TaxID=84751 RepID=A0A5C3F469_9BASI|nr:uncharacterized protein PFL1_04707 [Pseudozyma flocculosa PF-1]EPQ27569.1 hypothetical protein PFL1_04707 [Pseudozyma flocculosa PF-1]SPO39303.1 uncharacterized protein PSFLO_04783 [Pseudozyma flocculosa]